MHTEITTILLHWPLRICFDHRSSFAERSFLHVKQVFFFKRNVASPILIHRIIITRRNTIMSLEISVDRLSMCVVRVLYLSQIYIEVSVSFVKYVQQQQKITRKWPWSWFIKHLNQTEMQSVPTDFFKFLRFFSIRLSVIWGEEKQPKPFRYRRKYYRGN